MLEVFFTLVGLLLLIGLSCGVWVVFNLAKLGVMQIRQEMDELNKRKQ